MVKQQPTFPVAGVDNPVYIIKLEIITEIDKDTLDKIQAGTILYIQNVAYRLVPYEEK